MSYQPRSTNPYIMEKKLNECVGGGGFDPSVLEEIEAEISVLGSENATMAQDIIDIKGSLNSINDNLTALETRIAKVTVSDSTRIALTPNTEYVTLADGYFRIVCNQGTTSYVDGYVNGSGIIRTTIFSGTSGINGIYVKKGSTIKCILSSTGVGDGYFYPLA